MPKWENLLIKKEKKVELPPDFIEDVRTVFGEYCVGPNAKEELISALENGEKARALDMMEAANRQMVLSLVDRWSPHVFKKQIEERPEELIAKAELFEKARDLIRRAEELLK